MGAALPRSGGSFDWALMAEGEGAAAAAGARVVELEAQVEALEAELAEAEIRDTSGELLRVVGGWADSPTCVSPRPRTWQSG